MDAITVLVSIGSTAVRFWFPVQINGNGCGGVFISFQRDRVLKTFHKMGLNASN